MEVPEITQEELKKMMQEADGEFVISVELTKEDETDAKKESI